MDEYFDDPFVDEDDEDESLIDKYVSFWSATDVDKYLMLFERNFSEAERLEIDLYFIDKYFPGTENLSDDELVREKYYSSKHSFQYAVSIKRMVEQSGQGCVFADRAGWRYGFGGSA